MYSNIHEHISRLFRVIYKIFYVIVSYLGIPRSLFFFYSSLYPRPFLCNKTRKKRTYINPRCSFYKAKVNRHFKEKIKKKEKENVTKQIHLVQQLSLFKNVFFFFLLSV